MKQLQYFTLASFLLVKALSAAELTIKDIKPHIDKLENEFIALTDEVDNLIGEYKKSIGDEFNFRDDSLFGEIREGESNKSAVKRHERRTEENKAYFEKRTALGEERKKKEQERKSKEKEEKEKAKTEKLNKEQEEKKKILKNLEEILKKSNEKTFELKHNNENIKIVKILPKDIKDGAQKKVKAFSVILKTAETLNNIKNLKTFNQIKEFTHNFNYSKTLTKEDINITYLYSIFLSILTQKEKNILELAPILDLNKDEITKLKENKNGSDSKKIEGILKKITNIIYKYSIAFENINKPDIDKFDEFIVKNHLSFDYTDTTSNDKDYFDDKNKIVKKDFKDKSLNDMKLSTVFSSKKDEDKVAAESPKLLALLNRFKGTEEENKAMSVKQAVNIIIDFLRLRKSLGYIETTKKREIEYKSTTNERKSKIEINIEALTQKKADLIVDTIDTFKKIDQIYEKDISPADAFKEAKALIQDEITKDRNKKNAEQKLNDYNIFSKEIEMIKSTLKSAESKFSSRPEKLKRGTKEEWREKRKTQPIEADNKLQEKLDELFKELKQKHEVIIQEIDNIYSKTDILPFGKSQAATKIINDKLGTPIVNEKTKKTVGYEASSGKKDDYDKLNEYNSLKFKFTEKTEIKKSTNKTKRGEALDKLKESRATLNKLRGELEKADALALKKIDGIYNKTNITLDQKKEEASKEISGMKEDIKPKFIEYSKLKLDLKEEEGKKLNLLDEEKNNEIATEKTIPQSKSHGTSKGQSIKKSSNQSHTPPKKTSKRKNH